jgi:hypothetical protein
MKHKRDVAVKYIEKDIDLSLLVKNIVDKLVSTTTFKEVQ